MKKTLVKYPYLTRDVEVYERENGHKIVLAHKEGGMVNISSWVRTGSINENDENNGISHFLEHLMFKGTHKHKAGYFDRTLEAKGAIVNAATWKDYTFYYVTLPKGEGNKDFYEAIELHADMMLDPVLPEEEIGSEFDLNDENVKDKRERHVVIEEIRMRKDQPWTKVYNMANHSMYKKHPYKRDVIGTPEIISQVPQSAIMEYYKTHYTPNNVTTIVVGDFDHEEILEKVCKEFDWQGRDNYENPKFEIDKPTDHTIYLEDTANVNTGFLMFGYLTCPASNVKDTILVDLINIILGDGASSRLYQNLIEKAEEPVFNIIDTDHYQFRDGNNFFVEANFRPDKKETAVDLIKKEIESIKSSITEKEFNKAVKKTKSQFAHNAETVSEIGDTIGNYMTVCNDLKLVEDYLDILNHITIEDVQDAAKKYLNINNAVISVLMPQEKIS
ncbi:insulinase family protein [bacterium]|nr:insulinase family protein [bacterium]